MSSSKNPSSMYDRSGTSTTRGWKPDLPWITKMSFNLYCNIMPNGDSGQNNYPEAAHNSNIFNIWNESSNYFICFIQFNRVETDLCGTAFCPPTILPEGFSKFLGCSNGTAGFIIGSNAEGPTTSSLIVFWQPYSRPMGLKLDPFFIGLKLLSSPRQLKS